MMKRKILSLILAVFMLLALVDTLAVDAQAATSGSCGSKLTWEFNSDTGTLTISGTGKMTDFTSESDRGWAEHTAKIKKIVIKSGVTSIGSRAFYGCENATGITIPSTVTSIGSQAINGCNSLTSIKIPEGITTLNGTFQNLTGLTSVELPDTLKTIGHFTFFGCTSLATVDLPDGLETLGWSVFTNCSSLTSITIPDSVTSLGSETFSGCTKLSEVKLSGSLTDLPSLLFYKCSSLTSIVIPKKVASIQMHAFSECSSLSSIQFTGDAPAFNELVFEGTTATATYPAGNTTWTKDVRQNYGGTITWVAKSTSVKAPVVKVSNNAGSGKPKLTWEAVDGASSYKVYRATTKNGSYTLLKTVTGTSFTNTGAETGKLYYYKVKAVSSTGKTSSYSNIVSRTCDLARPAVKISNDAVTGKPSLSWKAVDGAVKYQIYRSTSKTGTYSLLKTTTATSMVNKNAVSGKLYYYKVMAIHTNENANSAYSSVVSRTCDLAKPVIKVTNDAATGKPKISWEAVDGAVSYKVYRSTSRNGSYSLQKTTTDTSMINQNAVAGKQYYYKVIAVHSKSAANSAYSSIVSRTCDLPRPDVTLKLNSSGKPRLSWEAVEGAVEYQVYRSTSKNGTYKLVKTTANTYWANTGAADGKTYYYKVKAVASNTSANSAFSAIQSITTG